MIKYQFMGVINITPDSFSDGGSYQNSSDFVARFNHMSQYCEVLDLGAESTAPMNEPIGHQEERQRFDTYFLDVLDSLSMPKYLSIDTYKIETIKYIADKIWKVYPTQKIIFNDVSGVVDSDLLRFLDQYSHQIIYILCHSLVPNRKETSHHMKYTRNKINPIVEMQEKMQLLQDFQGEVWVDPCFGFAKTRAQNQELINNFTAFADAFMDYSLVYAISRKSFLRFPATRNAKDVYHQQVLDQMSCALHFQLLNVLQNPMVTFRVHDISCVEALNSLADLQNSSL